MLSISGQRVKNHHPFCRPNVVLIHQDRLAGILGVHFGNETLD